MSRENNEILNIFRVRRTVLQMLRDRGYLVFDTKDDLNMTRADFESKYVKNYKIIREQLEIKRPKWNSANTKLLAAFVEGEKEKSTIGVKSIRIYCERIKQDNYNNIILILHGRLTPHAKQAICAINSGLDKIEYFSEAELVVNITEHILVPKHQILSTEETKCLLKRYSLNESQLPRIQKNDPVARYLGLQKNQIVKIIRPSETSGRYITYRRCTI
nr:RNA polymerase I, II and III 24.3 kDa subunit [Cryptomonas curvata]